MGGGPGGLWYQRSAGFRMHVGFHFAYGFISQDEIIEKKDGIFNRNQLFTYGEILLAKKTSKTAMEMTRKFKYHEDWAYRLLMFWT